MDIDSRHPADDVNRLSADRLYAAAKSVQNAHDEELPLPPVTPGDKTRRTDLREQRRRRQHGCWDQLIVAPLWVAYEANLGTLLRTCDAVGACMAVPGTDHYHHALERGATLARGLTSTGCGGQS